MTPYNSVSVKSFVYLFTILKRSCSYCMKTEDERHKLSPASETRGVSVKTATNEI